MREEGEREVECTCYTVYEGRKVGVSKECDPNGIGILLLAE